MAANGLESGLGPWRGVLFGIIPETLRGVLGSITPTHLHSCVTRVALKVSKPWECQEWNEGPPGIPNLGGVFPTGAFENNWVLEISR